MNLLGLFLFLVCAIAWDKFCKFYYWPEKVELLLIFPEINVYLRRLLNLNISEISKSCQYPN